MDLVNNQILTENQRQFWRDNSYLHFSGFFASQVDDLSKWVNEVSQWESRMDQWMCYYEMDNPTQLSRIENFLPYHQQLSDLITGDHIINLISSLMGEEAVLYKERITLKSPQGGPHAAHQDGVAYEQGENESFDSSLSPYISILISVDEATKYNGCLQVVPDWPLDDLKILPMEAPFPDKPQYMKMKQTVEDELTWKMLPTKPGDVLLFTERLPHRSAPNLSNNTRRIIYGVYNPLSLGDKREKYYRDKRQDPNDARYMVGNPHAKVSKTEIKY